MSRELRRVPAGWVHPTKDGEHIPLRGGSFSAVARAWDNEKADWEQGRGPSWWPPAAQRTDTWEQWNGARPISDEYMPDWPQAERTHLQLYECSTEGTPLCEPMASIEEIAHWFSERGEAFASNAEPTHAEWMSFLEGLVEELEERERKELGAPKIFLFRHSARGDDESFAMAEDGTLLANHVTSAEGYVPVDLGEQAKGAAYRAHYPGGYVLVYVRSFSVPTHDGLQKAIEANRARRALDVEALQRDADRLKAVRDYVVSALGASTRGKEVNQALLRILALTDGDSTAEPQPTVLRTYPIERLF